MLNGLTRFPKLLAIAQPVTPSKPSWISTSMRSPQSNRHAASDVISCYWRRNYKPCFRFRNALAQTSEQRQSFRRRDTRFSSRLSLLSHPDCRSTHSSVSTSTGSAEAVTRLRLPQNVACGFPALRSSGVGSQHYFVCYLFESCCHGRRFISLHRWPYLPLHGGHVAFEQFNARWPLPHVAGSPDLGVLSASLTAAGSSDRSRRFGLAGPTSVRLSPTALPCSHGTFGQHAGGTNPGSISRRSPWRVVKFCLPPSGIRSATSTTIDFGANCPFTFVPAYCLPVYASQGPLPDATQ